MQDSDDSDIPGGKMESRPVHFIWLLDCSGSMSMNGKIDSLNYAVREAIPEMRDAARSNPGASLMVRVITFASGATWHVREPVPVEDFGWDDVGIYGITDMGAAFTLAAAALETPPMPQRALRPVLVLVSDGQPTDDWRAGLRALDSTPWGQRAVRIAIGIGKDADRAMLQEYLANPELQPLEPKNPRQLVQAIRWASTAAVQQASQPRLDSGGNGAPLAPPVLSKDDKDPDVW